MLAELPLASIDALHRAVAHAAAELDLLAGRRRSLAELVASWQGGHRMTYEDELARLERRSAQLRDVLVAGQLALRRAADEAARAARATLVAGAAENSTGAAR